MTQTPAVVELENAPAVENTAIKELAQSINFEDPALSVSYGADSMTEIADFADSLLSNVRAKDAGPIGDSLTNLMVQVKSFDIDQMGKKTLMERMPVIGSFFDSAKRQMAQFKTVTEQISVITDTLDTAMVGLLKDVHVLEQLYEYNKKFHYDLSLYIAAGKERLEHARTVELPALQAEADASDDSMIAQKVKDFADRINRFERRLHDLLLSRTITLQTAPQIRLIQSNNQTLAEKIQTSILSTIPIWKNQLVLGLSLQGQQNAARLQKDVADTTNALLRKNAEMLEGAAIATATEVERSVIDIETIRDVQSRLISTIEETLRITQEGRTRRAEIESELALMESDLKTRLGSLAAQKQAAIIGSASASKALTAGKKK